jgi:hypothetical protein
MKVAALDQDARPGIAPDRIVEWLRALGSTWREANLREEQAEVLHAIYDRITVSGRTIVSARGLQPRTGAGSPRGC